MKCGMTLWQTVIKKNTVKATFIAQIPRESSCPSLPHGYVMGSVNSFLKDDALKGVRILRVRFFKKIQDWILKSERIRK